MDPAVFVDASFVPTDKLGRVGFGIYEAAQSFVGVDEKVKYYTTGSPSDLWLIGAEDYCDWTHPTVDGNIKFANRLLPALTEDVRSFFPEKCGGSGSQCIPMTTTPSPETPAPSSLITPAPVTAAPVTSNT